MIISKHSIKTQIQTQVPWFYNQEYPLFIKFLEYYYEWAETFSEETPFGYQAILDNLTSFQDIDETLEELIPFFKSLYFRLLPEETFVPSRLFAKRIIDLYKLKGTYKSIELLIYIILGKPIEIFFPKTLLARSSDVIFGNNFYIICSQEDNLEFSLFFIEKKIITIDGSEFFVNNIFKYYNFFILSLDLNDSFNFSSNEIYFNNILIAKCYNVLTSITIEKSITGFKLGDLIYSKEPSENLYPVTLIVTEISKGQIDSYSIIFAGKKYKKGDKFYNDDINFLAEVFKVDEDGGVLEIIFTKNSHFIEEIPKIYSLSKKGNNLEIIWKCSELGRIQNAEILFPGINIQKNVKYSTNNNVSFKSEISYIIKDLKSVSVLNNLGNYNILPDNFYYQKFSYEIEIELQKTFKFKDVVKDLVHPPGFLNFYKNTFFESFGINSNVNFLSLNSEVYFEIETLYIISSENINFYELLKYSNGDNFLNFSDFNINRFNELYFLESDVNISLENIYSLSLFDNNENIDIQITKLNQILNLLTSN